MDASNTTGLSTVWLWPVSDRRDHLTRERIVSRIRAEFLESPGLRLTVPQASRLFAVRRDACRRLLEQLVHDGTLTRGNDDRYGIYPR